MDRPGTERRAHSALSIGLPAHEPVTGALNVYATTPDAFDHDAIVLGQAFAAYVAVILANIRLYDAQADLARHLRTAMESRAVIEQAKGIIMSGRHCTADEAFANPHQGLADREPQTSRRGRLPGHQHP